MDTDTIRLVWAYGPATGMRIDRDMRLLIAGMLMIATAVFVLMTVFGVLSLK